MFSSPATPAVAQSSRTTTVLQNVAVIAAGHTLERTASGEAQNTPVITLLVSPDDANASLLPARKATFQLVFAQSARHTRG